MKSLADVEILDKDHVKMTFEDYKIFLKDSLQKEIYESEGQQKIKYYVGLSVGFNSPQIQAGVIF